MWGSKAGSQGGSQGSKPAGEDRMGNQGGTQGRSGESHGGPGSGTIRPLNQAVALTIRLLRPTPVMRTSRGNRVGPGWVGCLFNDREEPE